MCVAHISFWPFASQELLDRHLFAAKMLKTAAGVLHSRCLLCIFHTYDTTSAHVDSGQRPMSDITDLTQSWVQNSTQ